MDPRPERTIAQRLGDAAEDLVATGLEARGWRILARHVRVGRLELDLVAEDPGPPSNLVAVEVRWRGRRDFGIAEETIDWRKRAHLRAAFGRLLEARELPGGKPLPDLPVRLDVVVVEPGGDEPRIRHHRAVG
jgi:putative endonuclease